VWIFRDSLKMMPGVALPLAMTVLRDANGDLAIVSPVSGLEEWGPAVEALGSVRSVIAPSGFHHLFAKPAFERYPSASLVASGALKKKRPDFPATTRWLEGDARIDVAPGIAAFPVLGMKPVQEWVFLHEASGTLVVTDLLFHVLAPSFGLGLVQRAFGTYKKLAVSKLFVGARKDRDAYERSLRVLQGLDFDRLVVAHGEPILAGAKPRVVDALAGSP
jgi:hypothetical protein